MKITDDAKKLIEDALVSNDCDCMRVTLEKSCCGTSLSFSLEKSDPGAKPVSINGINVMMDEQAQTRAENILLDVEDGDLVIKGDENSSCCC